MQPGSVQNCQAGEAISDFPKGAVKQTAGAKGQEFLPLKSLRYRHLYAFV